MYKKILTGSSLFFSSFETFSSKDIDYIILTDDPKIKLKYIHQYGDNNEDLFVIKKEPKEKLIDYFLNKAPFMSICSLLNPEFCIETGITIDDLKAMHIHWEKMPKHYPRQYLKIIYDSYLENNDFILTEDQRKKAYDMYKKYHKR